MNFFSNKKLTVNAQKLRSNMTKEERHLWYDFLKEIPKVFKRQKAIGKYIVDFYCPEYKIVIEIDGSQHFEDKAVIADKQRDAYLKNLGLTVLRYSNYDINHNFDGVCEDIKKNIGSL